MRHSSRVGERSQHEIFEAVNSGVRSIHITADSDVVDLLGDSPEQIERHALEVIVHWLYQRHEISAGRAAEILGQDEFEFARWSGSFGIPYFDTNAEDWEQQLRAIEKE